MSAVSCTTKCTLNFNQTPSSGPLANTPIQFGPAVQAVLKAGGVAADQIDTVHDKVYTFVASTAQPLDLSSLTDVLNNAITFVGGRVRLIAFQFQGEVDGSYLLLGNAGTNEWDAFLSAGGTLKVFPATATNDGFFILSAPNTTGMPVDSTHKILEMTPSAHAFSVRVVVAGCSS